MDLRRFATLLAGSIAAPGLPWEQAASAETKTVLYSRVGGDLTVYGVDIQEASLLKRNIVSLPANVQYAWPHPSKRYFYVVSSGGGPGVPSNQNFAHAFRIDPSTGVLTPHDQPQSLPSRPIHSSDDMKGEYMLTAYNDPRSQSVHRINCDEKLGETVHHPNNVH